MIEKALNICIQSITACADWFTEILDSVEGGKFYIAVVFIVLVCGFLLARFRVSMYVGSDLADKGAEAYKKFRSAKSDRAAGRTYKPSGYIGPGKDMRWR